jgi:tetratricopeptide (TPR) repeat protein
MKERKKIKIFTAYDKDVEENVIHFGDFLCGLNVQCPNIELSVFKSEKELCESLERSKEQIDAELASCDFFLLVLGGTREKFSMDKLNQAIEYYAKTHGNPDIHIFVNAENKDADKVINYFASDKYEHYVEQFRHNDTLKAKFLVCLSAKQKEFNYVVDTDIHGTPVIKVNGVPVSGLIDFDALLNNEDYQSEKKKLIRKRADREKYQQELLETEGEERSDLQVIIDNLAKEIDELQEKIAAMERNTLALYQNYAEKTLKSGYNAKLKKAIECMERGELDRARLILDPEGRINNLKLIVNKFESLDAQKKTERMIAEQEIDGLFTEIDRLKLDIGNKNRFIEIDKCYMNIEYFQEKLGLEMTVWFDYALFLEGQNKRDAAIEKYIKESVRMRKLTENNQNVDLVHFAGTLNNLAALQKNIGRNEEAESIYKEALEISRRQAETNPDNLKSQAMTLTNIAALQTGFRHYEEAEGTYTEALEILRKLAGINNETYLQFLGATLYNLAVLQENIGCNKKAERTYTEALEVLRRLTEINPDVHLQNMVTMLYNLAVFQTNTGRYKEAENGFIEALEIGRKLAETNPKAFLPFLVGILNNLVAVQKNTGNYNEAEKNYAKALEIRKLIVKNNQKDE